MALSVLAAPCACGGAHADGSLDCMLAAGDNCFKTVVSAALACLPASSAQGTLGADGATCSYANGVSVAFDQPLQIGPAADLTGFTLTSGGAPCLRFQQGPGNRLTVATSAGSVTFSQSGGTATLQCPDGATHSASIAELVSCYGVLPGRSIDDTFSGTDGGYRGTFGLTLTGTSNPNGTVLFDCASP